MKKPNLKTQTVKELTENQKSKVVGGVAAPSTFRPSKPGGGRPTIKED